MSCLLGLDWIVLETLRDFHHSPGQAFNPAKRYLHFHMTALSLINTILYSSTMSIGLMTKVITHQDAVNINLLLRQLTQNLDFPAIP